MYSQMLENKLFKSAKKVNLRQNLTFQWDNDPQQRYLRMALIKSSYLNSIEKSVERAETDGSWQNTIPVVMEQFGFREWYKMQSAKCE